MENIRIVLVETSHPGNIGSVARAMKTMGLSELYLVKPKVFPSDQATALAVSADDILDNAVVVDTIDAALAGCELIFGTSARRRGRDWPLVSPREMADKVKAYRSCSKAPIAIIFGRERTGLSNDELMYCHYHVCIPTNPEYMSLNLAQAVQVIAYDLRVALIESGSIETVDKTDVLADHDTVEGFYQHLEDALYHIEFLRPQSGKEEILMHRLRRLFQRAKLESEEIRILRGMCSMMQRNAGGNNE